MQILKIGSKGPEVKEIQATLNKIGINVGKVDGIYGTKTEDEIKRFQQLFNLLPTGVVDEDTYEKLENYILGYEIYTLKEGDTLSEIAKRYNTPLNKIVVANPNVDTKRLITGTEIVIPYAIDVVNTDIDYTYDILKKNIKGLKERYPFIEIGSIGKSVLEKELYFIKLGKGPNKVFYNGVHHAIEWITTTLLMKFVENFSKAYAENKKIEGYNITDIFNSSTIYIVPMVNPDGVDLVIEGLKKDNPYYEDLIKWNQGSQDFSKNWSANIRGVDLNHNYDASWQKSKEAEKQYGVFRPGPTRYSGTQPESEPESKAVSNFTRENDFRLVIAYHSQGEVIFWNYLNMANHEARKIGEEFAKLSGYELSETYGITSFAGYKDWFIEKYKKPGYTFEVGLGSNPLPIEQFDKIYNDNIKVLLKAAII